MEGKVIIVTGGASGIGRSVCLELALKKCKVVVADINYDQCLETIEMMKKAEPSSEGFAVLCDISKSDQVTNMMSETIKRFERVDGAVNNAGILGSMGRIGDYDEAMFTKMLNINVMGTFLCIKSQVQQMEKQGPSNYSIVNISSIAGILGFPYNSGYSAVKHAILGLTKSTAAEYGCMGIRCNSVLPGASDTPMLQQYIPTDEARAQLIGHTPLRRLSQPNEIAKSVVYLLSNDSSFVTGQSLVVDGGLSII
ncbi:short-chain dehydrogenase/reductase (SDR) family protein [Tieghemostelium lacteum]|uniref:Short-chain dehydrogenase/reductase (SDR) family protein n=1 Tax=Tieghemostelium lacteum TaxID=361077 RepID=A0A151ZCF7_TIELA|nr:short-chain dehydrogenase/reductase (SDR) family protein [Tieghemostelium lacteum]|eukprot:KYQ91628.1 short-chain dehydrogenase/reductase (SDR) family protein [Tieghemostelium lacteum]